jgi:hypothetical protein
MKFGYCAEATNIGLTRCQSAFRCSRRRRHLTHQNHSWGMVEILSVPIHEVHKSRALQQPFLPEVCMIIDSQHGGDGVGHSNESDPIVCGWRGKQP